MLRHIYGLKYLIHVSANLKFQKKKSTFGRAIFVLSACIFPILLLYPFSFNVTTTWCVTRIVGILSLRQLIVYI